MKNMFCATCGTLLQPKNTKYGRWMSCPNGHWQPTMQTQGAEHREHGKEAQRITVHDGKNILAVHDHLCKFCGHDKAQLIERSCAYSDEDNIYQMKCGKCGKIEQLEGKVT